VMATTIWTSGAEPRPVSIFRRHSSSATVMAENSTSQPEETEKHLGQGPQERRKSKSLCEGILFMSGRCSPSRTGGSIEAW
jgi:hypothetical protein